MWNIFDKNNQPLCEFDSVSEIAHQAVTTVPAEPQEGGRLFAYDKVKQPEEVSLELLLSTGNGRQEEAVTRIKTACTSTMTYTIVTPHAVYENFTLQDYSLSRTSTDGASLLAITLTFREVLSIDVQRGSFKWSPKNANSSDVKESGSRGHESVLHSIVS